MKRTVEVSLGEIIETIYEDLVTSYGDEDLAMIAAEAAVHDLLSARTAPAE